MKEKLKEDLDKGIDKYNKLMKDKKIIAILLLVQGLFYFFTPLGSIEFDVRITLACILLYLINKVIDNFKNKSKLITYIIITLLDIFFLIKVDIIISILHIVFGLILILIGIYNLINTTKIKNSNKVTHIISYILLITMIIVGVFLLFEPLNTGTFILKIIGLVLIIDSIIDLIIIYNE